MKKLIGFSNRLFITVISITAFSLNAKQIYGQVKVGENPALINAGAVLEIESTDKGLLLPRVSLTNTTTWGLSGSPVAGMQVFNNNINIVTASPVYPPAQGGLGVYYWDGIGWVPTKASSSDGDFDWLKNSDNNSPSAPADISNGIYHGGDGNQEVTVRTTETDPGKLAKLTVSAGHGSFIPIIGNFIAGTSIIGERLVGFQTDSRDPIVFRLTDFPNLGPLEQMRITPSGTVGIKTSTPSVLAGLHVDAPIVQTDYDENESDANSSIHLEYGGIHLFNNGTDPNGVVNFKDNAADHFDARIFYRNTYGNNGALTFEVSSAGGFNGNKRAVTILNENGHVGINETSPAYQLSVGGEINASGKVRSAGMALTSDKRLKQNILPIQDGLGIVSKLNPVSYRKKASLTDKIYDKSEMGFIAQEVQKILPQLVEEGKDAGKILALDYNSIIPILTKAIQEQQEQIKSLTTERDKQSAQLNSQSAQLDSQSARLDSQSVKLEAQAAELNEIKRQLNLNSKINSSGVSK